MKNNQQFKDEESRDKIQCQEAGCEKSMWILLQQHRSHWRFFVTCSGLTFYSNVLAAMWETDGTWGTVTDAEGGRGEE